MHAVNVLGAGLDPHQDDVIAAMGPAFGRIGIERDLARGRARRCRQALGHDIALRCGIERGMKQLVERHRIDPRDRLVALDQAFAFHLDRDLERGLGGALAGAGLQHPELAAFHGEFDVLHVAIVLLEQVEHAGELAIGFGHGLFHRGGLGAGGFARGLRQIARGADTGDDILALRVDQVFAVIGALAGRGIAGEGDAGRAGIAHIAEHHRLHVHRGAHVVRDVVQPAIGARALGFPTVEHGADRTP